MRIVPFIDMRYTFTDWEDASPIPKATDMMERLLKPSTPTKPKVVMCGVAFKNATPSNGDNDHYHQSQDIDHYHNDE